MVSTRLIFQVIMSATNECGMVKAYQKGTTNALYPTSFFFGKDDSIIPDTASASIDGVYVDGISITSGKTHKHVWTYAAGLNDNGAAVTALVLSIQDLYHPLSYNSIITVSGNTENAVSTNMGWTIMC